MHCRFGFWGEFMKYAAFALVASLGLAGCQHITPDYRAMGAEVNGVALMDLDLTKDFEARFKAETSATTESERDVLRREMVATLLAVSDVRCENYLVGVGVYANGARASFDLAGLALSTAGGVATPEESANLLSALATFAGGARDSLSQTVFAGRDYPVLYAAIRNGRRAQRDRYLDAAHDGDFDTWGHGSITALMTSYDVDCGINYGLQLISDAVAAQGAQGRRDIAPPADAAAEPPEDERVISQPTPP